MNTLCTTSGASLLSPQYQWSQLQEMYLKEMDCTPKTFHTYSKGIKNFISYLHKINSVEDNLKISTTILLDYKRDLITLKYKPTTTNTYINAVKQFFNYLTDKGIISKQFYQNVKPIKNYCNGVIRDAVPSDKESELLNLYDKTTEQGMRNHCIIATALTLGLRANEIVNINIEDIKLASDGYYIKLLRKGYSTKCMEIQLPKELFNLYTKYLSMKNPKYKTSESPLFTRTSNNGYGKKMSTTSISVLGKQALKDVGLDLPSLTFHSFRHAFCVDALSNGADLQDVSKAMGHSSTTITEKAYDSHITTMNNQTTNMMAQRLKLGY